MSAIWTKVRLTSRSRWVAALVMAAMPIVWASSAAHAAPREEALLIADEAHNLFLIHRSAASRQISYTMTLAYPARAIGEPQWEQLKKAGWARCRSLDPDQEAANADWINFRDAAARPERTVHQHLTNWFKDNQMITISLRYYSAPQSRSGKARPDNTEQHVDMIFDDDHGRDAAEWLQLDCSK